MQRVGKKGSLKPQYLQSLLKTSNRTRPYAGQKDLVAKTKAFLADEPKLGPVPWVDGERLLMKIFNTDGIECGIWEYRADKVQSEGKTIWSVGARVDSSGIRSVSSVNADAENFHPISSRWKHSNMLTVEATYRPGEVETKRQGLNVAKTTKVDSNVVDSEQVMHLIRRLPLKENFKTTLPVYSSLGGGAVAMGMEVVAKEVVDVPAGRFESYKVTLDFGQIFWFSNDAYRYPLKFELGGATVVLAGISQRKSGEPVVFRDSDLGISLTAPADWVVCRYKHGQPAGQALIRTYDADADSEDCGIRYFSTDLLPKNEQKSSKAWAESMLKNRLIKRLSDLKVRPDSWEDCEVAGRPGVGFIADYSVNGKAKTIYSLCVVGPKNSENFILICPSEKFDKVMKEFDGIIASYQRN